MNIRYTRRRKQKCVGHHYAQANTNNVRKIGILLQSTGEKDEPNIVLCGNRYGHYNTELRT